jgi:F-type H+-transporting ATPase subunit b
MAEPTAHTEVPGGPGGHPAFPPFQRENFASQLVWLSISFVLLYVLMAKIALPRVGGILAARQKHIADDLAAANDFKAKSEAANAAYEKKLADARARAQAIAAETREKQAAEAEATNKRLEAELHQRLAAAEQSIAATRTAAMGHVDAIAVDTASAIVARLIGTTPADHEVRAAVSATLKR